MQLRSAGPRAAFPTVKTFDAWDQMLSSVPAPTQSALRTPEWIDRRENLVVCGPAGTGKHVAWFTLEALAVLIRLHRAADSVTKAVTRILRADQVVVDDTGLLPVGPDAAEGLYRLVDAAYERRSVAVSDNLHPSGLDELMPETLAAATSGKSVRLAQALARPWRHPTPRHPMPGVPDGQPPTPARRGLRVPECEAATSTNGTV